MRGAAYGQQEADLGKSHKEGPDIGAEVACRRQVSVHFPALPKLLQPVVKLARHHHLHIGPRLILMAVSPNAVSLWTALSTHARKRPCHATRAYVPGPFSQQGCKTLVTG